MKYKAKYGAESDIPAEVKAFYVLADGEWVFNGKDFDGLDALLNPGLAANRDTLKAEKLTVTTERDNAVKERDQAQKDLAKATKPGTIFMDPKDKEELDEFRSFGTPKDVKAKLENEKVTSEKLGLLSQESEIRNIAKAAGLNEDALVDFKLNSERGKNVSLAVEKRKVKDAKGVESEKDTLVVKITNNVDGKDVVSTKLFADFAKENVYPEYLVTAIYAGQPAEAVADSKGKFQAAPSMKKKTDDDAAPKADVTSFVDRANQERSTRRMPWSTPVEKAD